MERAKQLESVEHFSAMKGFVESLLKYEENRGKSLGDQFVFSKKEYLIGDHLFRLGKVNELFFIGRENNFKSDFLFFENRNALNIYLNRYLREIDTSLRGFWMNEVNEL